MERGLKKLQSLLEELASAEHYLWSLGDFKPAFLELSDAALKMLLGRAVKNRLLERVCRNIYLYNRVPWPKGLILYHIASKLRAGFFNYLSLETVLSEAGVISQIPLQWISIMSSGRSNTVNCGKWGMIEFVHTSQSPLSLRGKIFWDSKYRLWRAKPDLAWQDMKNTKRPTDLVNMDFLNEYIH